MHVLKNKLRTYQMERGIWDADKEEELQNDEEIKKFARRRFQDLVADKTGENQRTLLMDTFEDLLSEKRLLERKILNQKREVEYEKHRPPQQGWYELKTPKFSEELYRNRMEMKPNDENKTYLRQLKDDYLY